MLEMRLELVLLLEMKIVECLMEQHQLVKVSKLIISILTQIMYLFTVFYYSYLYRVASH